MFLCLVVCVFCGILRKKGKGVIMKKIVSFAVLAMLTVPAFSAPKYRYIQRTKAAPSHWLNGAWYGVVRGEMSLLSWKNKYSSDDLEIDGKSESFSFEPVFGGSLAVGHVANANWRGEVEGGLIGQFTDSGYGADFKLTIPYLSVNMMYDFANNAYVGGGLGIAIPKVDLSWYTFDTDKRTVSPKFDLMAGYSHKLTESVSLDFRYRLSFLFGPDVKAEGVAYSGGYWLKTDVDMIINNSFSVGVRYDF